MKFKINPSKLLLVVTSILTLFIFEIYPVMHYARRARTGEFGVSGAFGAGFAMMIMSWFLWIVGWIVAITVFMTARQLMKLPKLSTRFVVLVSLGINVLGIFSFSFLQLLNF